MLHKHTHYFKEYFVMKMAVKPVEVIMEYQAH
jgi:hypothetical protein